MPQFPYFGSLTLWRSKSRLSEKFCFPHSWLQHFFSAVPVTFEEVCGDLLSERWPFTFTGVELNQKVLSGRRKWMVGKCVRSLHLLLHLYIFQPYFQPLLTYICHLKFLPALSNIFCSAVCGKQVVTGVPLFFLLAPQQALSSSGEESKTERGWEIFVSSPTARTLGKSACE